MHHTHSVSGPSRGFSSLTLAVSVAALGAVVGVIAVLIVGMLTARLFEWYLWLMIGPVVAVVVSIVVLAIARMSKIVVCSSLAGSFAGGVFGAFMAAACIETHHGISWVEYGALYGLISAAVVAVAGATGVWAVVSAFFSRRFE